MLKAIILTIEEAQSIKNELDTMIEYAKKAVDGKENSTDICEWIAEKLKRISKQFD